MFKKVLILSTIVLLSSCSTLPQGLTDLFKKPEVNYQSFSLGAITMDRIELKPTFNIANKNAYSIPVDAMSYELSLNENKMLAGQTQSIGSLPANDDKDVTLSIDLTQETLVSLKQLLFKDKQLTYQVKGSLSTLGFIIPFEHSATLYLPEIKVAGLKVENASFSQIDIILSLEIDNPNSFSLPLDSINYSVSSDDSSLFSGILKSQDIAEGQTSIQLPLSIKPSDMFSSMFALLRSPELPLHFEINTPLFSKTYDQTLNLKTIF